MKRKKLLPVLKRYHWLTLTDDQVLSLRLALEKFLDTKELDEEDPEGCEETYGDVEEIDEKIEKMCKKIEQSNP